MEDKVNVYKLRSQYAKRKAGSSMKASAFVKRLVKQGSGK